MKRVVFLLFFLLLTSNNIYSQAELKEGVYYIQNAENGGFLSAGATWGTRAVLSPHGVDFKVTFANGEYTLYTQIQGSDRALRPSDGYMDQSGSWIIKQLFDGSYSMYNGTNYFGYAPSNEHPWIPRLDYTNTNGRNTHWRFLTKEDLIATLANATPDNPVDATFFIKAPDILTGDYRITDLKVWGDDAPVIGGNMSGSNYTRNNANGEKYDRPSFNITQRLIGLPNGIYSLSVQGYYRYGNNESAAAAHNNSTERLLPYLYAGDKKAPLPSIYSEATKTATGGWATSTAAGYVPNTQSEAAECFNDGKSYLTTISDIVVVDGTLTIGIAKNSRTVSYDWTCFDNFTLMYYGSDLASIKEMVLNQIDEYAAKNTTGDEDFSNVIAQQKQSATDAVTETDVLAALDAVKKAYSIYQTKPEPTDKPLDFTSLVLENATLIDGTIGWDAMIENIEGYNQKWSYNSSSNVSVLETYSGFGVQEMRSFSLTQNVALSPGMYRIKAYSFYRYGLHYDTDLQEEGKEISCANLIAGDFSTPVMRLGEIEAASYANTLTEAADAFAAGHYLNTLVFELDEPTTLRIGFEGEHIHYRSWFVAGPIILEKINTDILANEAESSFAADKNIVKLKWENYKNISNQAIDHDSFDTLLETAKADLDDIKTSEALMLKDSEIWDALCHLIKTSTTESGQFDLTTLIENPNFNSNTNGWNSQNSITWYDMGMTEEFNRTSGDISQILHGMPSGSYILKAQAFYRMNSTGTANQAYEKGEDKVTAELYLNDSSVKLKSINDDARYRSARPSSDTPGAFDKTIPISLNGAHDAFESGLYWNILRTNVESDGDIQIGIRFSDGEPSNWLAFDNFRLYYGVPTQNINLSKDQKFEIEEDTYANITTDIELKAGRYNSICLPFDVDASQFESVWTIAGIDYDSENQTLTGTLVPAYEIEAGVGYLVKVNSDRLLTANEVVLRAAKPDSIPVMWEGGAMSGYYGRAMITRKYCLNDDGTGFDYFGVRVNSLGFETILYLPSNVHGKVRHIDLEEVDFDNMKVKINLENFRARAFLSEAKYPSSGASSVISNYNASPPNRRDQPHTALIPIPVSNSVQKLQYSQSSDYSKPTTINIPAKSHNVEVANLIPQSQYYYKVVSGNEIVSKGEIITEGYLRMIKAPTGSNIRDLGGWQTTDGNRIRYGLIYRGGEMNGGHQMDEADLAEMRRIGIAAEVDLRQDSDISGFNITKSALGANYPYIYLNQSMFGDDALEGDKDKYKKIFNFILDNLRHDRPVFFHCIWGADRTGATAFLLEGLLGVTRDNMYKDYELTTYSIAGLREKGGLDSKFDYITALKGSTLQLRFFNYWNEQVGISSDDLLEFIKLMTDGEPSILTEIDEIKTDTTVFDSTSDEYYSLDGRRMSKPVQGINIIRKGDGRVIKVISR